MRIRWLDSRSSQWDPQSLQSTHSNRRIRKSTQANFSGVLPTFRVVDTVFVFVFLGEFLLRLAVEGTAFFKDLANYLDAVLVAGGLFDIILSVNAGEDGATLRSFGLQMPWALKRFVTALKAFRAIRMVRSFRFFKGLRLGLPKGPCRMRRGLVKACQCCLPSLCWSMVLLAVFMCMGGLIMGNLLQDFIKDETQSLEDRQWVWQRYGTSYRATYTLYEITFAGNWPTNARPVLEKVNQGFVVFFLLYVTIIVFAVIRVISAIFLKDTLDEAHNDAQQLVMDRLKKKADYIQRLEGLFRTIDDSGAGMITEDRLTEILSNPKVKAYFQTLEIDVQEASTLFHLLDNGDGEVTLEAEFIDGIMRCKGPARAIDTVALHADLRQVDAKLAKLTKQLKETNLVQSRASKAKTLNAKQGRDPQKSQPGAGRFFLVHDVLVFLLQIQTANFLLSLLGSMFNPGFLGPFSKHPSWASQAIQARPAKHKHREPFMRLLKKRDAGEKRKKETRGEANRAPRSEGRPL
ncbi:unnamed protein product [Effrenium voratum]|nr:unnamed protein product [Effrenium voratum]